MASVRLGPIVADIRGSVADTTFGRNLGGIFVRERVSPAQPASSERDARQAGMTAIMAAWSGTLTQAQRNDWNKYGRQHLLPNRWGTPGARPGVLHFLRSNCQHYRVTSTILNLEAPVRPPAHRPTFSFTADASANTITVDVPPTNYPAPPTDSCIYLFTGHDLNPGRVFYNGPWRYIGWNKKQAVGWQTDPWPLPYPWTLTTGHHVYARLVFRYPDGATSGANQLMETVVA